MYRTDFEGFRGILDKCALVFGKPKPDDSLVQQYWSALKDLSVETVAHRADMHIRYGKHFPRPFELRPKDDKPKEKDSAREAEFRASVIESEKRLDELWHQNREEWLRIVSPKIYEMGRAKGMLDGEIDQKLRNYRPQR